MWKTRLQLGFPGFPRSLPLERLGRAARFLFVGRVSFAVPDKSPDRKPSPRKEASETQGLRYTSRGLRRRNNTDKREVTLSHVGPATGETVRTFHTVGAKTKKGAEKARDALIFGLGSGGGAVGSSMTVREFMEQSLRYEEASGTIEPSTARSYRGEAKQIYPALGAIRLAELTSADIDRWMAGMTAEGYAPKTVAKPFRLLKQALKWAVGQNLLTKNACDLCKPPKRAKTPINALSREDRSRMLALAREAIGQPLGLAIELTLTTGMRRGEVCAQR